MVIIYSCPVTVMLGCVTYIMLTENLLTGARDGIPFVVGDADV